MTEIVAAHLERVAKEVAREVFKAQHLAYREVDSTAWKCTCGETPKDIVEHWVGHVEGVLAAALAACAREARLQEANAAYWAWKLSHEDFGANQQERLDELRKEG